jgi:hypothetical protein
VSNYCALAMVLKAQRALGSALVRSPTTSKTEATINILYLPRRYAWQLFLFDFLRIQIRRTQLLMPFICLFLISLLGEFILVFSIILLFTLYSTRQRQSCKFEFH